MTLLATVVLVAKLIGVCNVKARPTQTQPQHAGTAERDAAQAWGQVVDQRGSCYRDSSTRSPEENQMKNLELEISQDTALLVIAAICSELRHEGTVITIAEAAKLRTLLREMQHQMTYL